MMAKGSRREQMRLRRRREKYRSYLLWGGIGLAALAVLGFLLWNVLKPAAGEPIPIMSSNHIPRGSLPQGGYNSDPPTSGPHYASPLDPGFYDETALATLGETADGHLVHNLEHGYIVFWYDCDALIEGSSCSNLQAQLRGLIDEFSGAKVIAFPRERLESPIVATSWGRTQQFERFDSSQASTFINRNQNRAPEPSAG